jgi:hypothetical protein
MDYIKIINESLQVGASPILDSYPLMRNPGPTLLILLCYWIFVFYAGPKLMKDRKPFELNRIITVYNLYQVIFSSWLLISGSQVKGFHKWIWNFGCGTEEKDMDVLMLVYYYGWWYMVNKFVELLDTVFFVLRKKQNHVSFLHVYHHSNMGLMTFAFLKYTGGEQLIIIGMMNSIVHVIMYFYYFIASLGPKYKKYLGWKKHLTRIQIIQFLVMISYFASVMIRQCHLHNTVTFLLVLNTASFLYLFIKYYQNAYDKRQMEKRKISDDEKHKLN